MLGAESVNIETQNNLCSVIVQTKRPIDITHILSNVVGALVDITGATLPSAVYGNILPMPKDIVEISFGAFSDLGK